MLRTGSRTSKQAIGRRRFRRRRKGREGKELRAKAAKQVRDENERQSLEKPEKAEKRRRSSIEIKPLLEQAWPGPAETDRPASAALPFDADLDGGTNKTTL